MVPVPPGALTGPTSSRKESRVNQSVAILRRVAAAIALLAAVALLSSLTPARSCAQADAQPADPALAVPSDSAAATGKKAKNVKAPKAAKVAKSKVEKAAKVAKPKPEKIPKAKPARAAEPVAAERDKTDGIYSKGSDWLSFRFGYAKRTGDLAGDGFVGYGVGYQHMMTRKYAFSAGVGHDIVGHFGAQLDEVVPFTAEFQRHFKWNTATHPYIGIGGGYYLRKNYRTGGEYNTVPTGGPHVSVGFTSALDEHHVIGFETRMARVQGRPGVVNPTFGPGEDTETIWTAKISWGLVY